MRLRRSLVLGVLLWLAVVGVVSTATWTVIDAVGRDVTARPASDPGAAGAPTGATTGTTTPSPSRRPTRTPTPTRTTAPATSTAVAPEPQVRTWSGSAGTLAARCTGTRIALVTVTPGDGWRMEVEDRGPERVRAKFEAGGDSSGEGDDSVDVRGECAGGVPAFRVDD